MNIEIITQILVLLPMLFDLSGKEPGLPNFIKEVLNRSTKQIPLNEDLMRFLNTKGLKPKNKLVLPILQSCVQII